MGILTQISQLALTKAYHHGSAAEVSNFINVGAIMAALLGYLFFGEFLVVSSLLGIGFILGGVALAKRET